MDSFEIRWRSSTKKDLRPIPREHVARIVAVVEQLKAEPISAASEKLTNSERTYRIRVGDYRVIYELRSDAKQIEIQRVRHRKDVYRH